MKKSIYNFIYEYKNEYLIYNSFRNSLALINKDEYEKYTKLDFSDDELKNFSFGGFLVEDTFNELQAVKYNMLSDRYSKRFLALTIAPTIDCNFRCVYCYEKHHGVNTYMSEKTQDNVINFIKEEIKNHEGLYVTWYGGEPLLATDIIDRLSKEFIKISVENKVDYKSYIVTNGYLLTEKNIKKLNDRKIDGMQVTIDGNRESHDNKRFLENKMPTYDTILSNLKKNYDGLINLSLRINLDEKNLGTEKEVIDEINKFDMDKKITPYIAKVRNENDTYDDNFCIESSKFDNYELNFYKKNENSFVKQLYPNIISNFCTADSTESFIFNYNGDVYKCWSEIGDDNKKIGSLTENGIENINYSNYFKYVLYDPTEDSECKKCKILPICMGGCPFIREEEGRECSKYKNIIKEVIFKTADIMEEKI